MKKFVIALTAFAALAATPALAGDTRIHVGFYSPEPVYYQPAPVYYAPPVAYYAPRFVRYEPPCPKRYGHRGHNRGHGWGHERRYESAWNEPRGYGWQGNWRDDD